MTRPSTRVLQILAAAVAVTFFMLPLAYLLSVSFKRKDDVLSGNFLPTDPTLANWPAASRPQTFCTARPT